MVVWSVTPMTKAAITCPVIIRVGCLSALVQSADTHTPSKRQGAMSNLRHPVRLAFLLFAVQICTSMDWANAASPVLKAFSDRALPFPQWRSPDGWQPILRKVVPNDGSVFISRPADIRWDDDLHVLVAARRDGTFRLPV